MQNNLDNYISILEISLKVVNLKYDSSMGSQYMAYMDLEGTK
jgi:hypothetical protein